MPVRKEALYPAAPNRIVTMRSMIDKQKMAAATQWLRPYTRWSARFAMAAPAWVPGFIRHAPIQSVNLILRGYQHVLRDKP